MVCCLREWELPWCSDGANDGISPALQLLATSPRWKHLCSYKAQIRNGTQHRRIPPPKGAKVDSKHRETKGGQKGCNIYTYIYLYIYLYRGREGYSWLGEKGAKEQTAEQATKRNRSVAGRVPGSLFCLPADDDDDDGDGNLQCTSDDDATAIRRTTHKTRKNFIYI